MGVCYSVEILIKTTKEAELIDAVQRYMENAIGVIFKDTHEPDSIENIARIFLADHQGMFNVNEDGSYSSRFNATYGWNEILSDWWCAMEPYLDGGSYMKVWKRPDGGAWEMRVF